MHQAAEYQNRRADDKDCESSRREKNLAQEPADITPANKKNHVWTGKDLDQFEKDWSMKPVSVSGIFDHSREIQVEKMNYRGERGVQIITPFYTHLDADGKEQAILVNRGWVPYDYKDAKYHFNNSTSGTIQGVLYRGDSKTKYSVPNTPQAEKYHMVTPYDLACVMQIPNFEESTQFMLHMVDMDAERRQVLPSCPDKGDLTTWRLSQERHRAYSTMWTGLAYAGVLANTALWLYL